MIEDPTQDANGLADEAVAIDETEALRAELEQLKAQSLIERADLENQRKRMARDLDNARKFANERLLGDLLPVLDSLEAGLATAAADDPLRAGWNYQRQLCVAESTAWSGAPGRVRPSILRHQAMSMIDAEGIAPGAVAQTFQKGYALNQRLLRPAMVVVARHD